MRWFCKGGVASNCRFYGNLQAFSAAGGLADQLIEVFKVIQAKLTTTIDCI